MAAGPAPFTPAETGVFFDVGAIATPAGGLKALATLLPTLPNDFPCAVLVLLHTHPDAGNWLVPILARGRPLPVREAAEGQRLRPGGSPAGPVGGALTLSQAEAIHFSRPSATVLFESVGQHYSRRALAALRRRAAS